MTEATTNKPTKQKQPVEVKKIDIPDVKVVENIKSMEELLKGEEDVVTFEKGDIVEGVVVAVLSNQILIDLDNVFTGVIKGQEMIDSKNTAKDIKVNDKIEAVVLAPENKEGQVVLSLKRASQERTWDYFNDVFTEGKIIKVKIIEANKGGLLIEVDGIRGFIPVSQLTPEHYPRVSGADPDKILALLNQLVGKEIDAKIINIDHKDRRLILSEKEAYAEERKGIISELTVGQTIEGMVSGVVNFGIFVNYKGVEGLVHISEIAWGHVSDPNDYAKVGEKIKVLVIGVEDDKVSFSMKRLVPDPWVEAAEKYAISQEVKGVVTRITPFGVFLKLDDEIDGLIHISELTEDDQEADINGMFKVSEEVKAKIISIELDEHRLGLSVKAMNGKKKKEDEKENKKEEEKDEKETKKDPEKEETVEEEKEEKVADKKEEKAKEDKADKKDKKATKKK